MTNAALHGLANLRASDEGDGSFTLLVGGVTPRIVGGQTVAADSNAFADGDIIANSATAGSVVPIAIDLRRRSGELVGIRAAVSVANAATLVLANLAFDLLVFRPTANVPFAAAGYPASNAALAWATKEAALAAIEQLVGVWEFVGGAQSAQGGTGWRSYGSGQAAYQRGTLLNAQAAPINLDEFAAGVTSVNALMVARGAWNNGNAAHTFRFAADFRGN